MFAVITLDALDLAARAEYQADALSHLVARDFATRGVISLRAEDTLAAARAVLAAHRHQGFPVLDENQRVVGVLTRRDLADGAGDALVKTLIVRAPVVVHADDTLRYVVTKMGHESVGRVPVLTRDGQLYGMLTRSDLFAAATRK